MLEHPALGSMRRIIVILILLAFATGAEARAEEGAAIFYVQLIRGTDTDQAPVPGAKAVGPKLAGTFRPVFKCKGFWEINRQQVAVSRREGESRPTGQRARGGD